MDFYPISKRVNSPIHNDSEIATKNEGGQISLF